jgi:hypothetical protein
MFRKTLAPWPVLFLSVAGLVSSSCGSSTSPTSPGTNASTSTTAGATSPTPGVTGALTVTANPNPVPFSGRPITDIAGCNKRNNTWFYEQRIEESNGSTVTINSEIDMFDGFVVNNLTGLKMVVPAKGLMILNPRWCSSEAKAHTAQSMFGGVDANGTSVTVNGPLVNLLAAPKN